MCLSVFLGFPCYPITPSIRLSAPQGFNYREFTVQYLIALVLASFRLPKVPWQTYLTKINLFQDQFV